jgi:hypothetical protein
MTLPVTIPNTFANATTSIPLANLDANFVAIYDAVNGIGNGAESLANVSITGGTVNNVAVSATTLNTSGQVVFNDAGADVDFRVEGDTDANLLFVDASTDRVGIGTSSPSSRLAVIGPASTTSTIRIEGGSGANTNAVLDLTGRGSGDQYNNIEIRSIGQDALGGTLSFHVDDTSGIIQERMRITSAGEVLVGGGTTAITAGPALTLVPSTVGIAGPQFNIFRDDTSVSSANYLGQINFYGNDTTGNTPTKHAFIGAIAAGTHSAGDNPTDLVFGTTPDGSETVAEVARFDGDGYLRMASGTGGIQFNGDTAAGNALDDYEEGTWTVEFYDASTGGNVSSTTGTGYYTKIGRQVTAVFSVSNIVTTGMTAGNVFYYTLPFANTDILTVGSIRLYANVNDATVSLCSQINANASRGAITESIDNSTLGNAIVSDFISGASDLSVTITYFV